MQTLARTRTTVVLALTLLLLGAAVGATVPLVHWRAVLEWSLVLGGGLAMVTRLDDELRSAWARWVLLGAGVVLAGAIGMVVRMVVQGLLSRAR